MTRLTLFIDPGRIKRGVKPLEDVGPALEEGREYTLSIDPAWKDANNQPLLLKFEKHFRVSAPDRSPPDPSAWKVTTPLANGREPVVVDFNESMDRALAQRLIIVTDSGGRPIDGQVELSAHERRWSFLPAKRWTTGPYRLVIGTTIEDLAGNNVGKPFEVDLFETTDRRLPGESVKLAFEVR